MRSPLADVLQELVSKNLVQRYEKLRERRWMLYTEGSMLRGLASYLRLKGAHLSAITCEETFNAFTLIYHFDYGGEVLNAVLSITKAPGCVDTIADIYPVADFYEREVSEMFGVKFINAPRTERLFLPDDWPVRTASERGGSG
jgi:NADH:ubiquinone oxidoreductase subunit C